MRVILVCTAMLGGLVIADLRPLQAPPLAAVALFSALAGLCLWRRPPVRLAAIAVCAAAIGALRAGQAFADEQAQDARLAPLANRAVRLDGTVLEPPVLTTGGRSTRLEIEALQMVDERHAPPPLGAPSDGAVTGPRAGVPSFRVRALGEPDLLGLEPAERIQLSGRLLAPDGRGPPVLVYARLAAPPEAGPPSPRTFGAALRAAAERAIQRGMPEPQGALAAGVLLGGSSGPGLDADFRLALQRSGLAHIVAIDGYKQLLLATFVGALVRRLVGAYPAAVCVVVCVVGYTVLTGGHPSAVRSGIMVGLASVALLVGRVPDALTSLLLATTAMALVDPPVLLDTSLQLSVSATLGLILLWPRFRRRLRGVPRPIAEPAGVTLAVTLATLPIELAVFQSVSLVSPVSHIVAVPLLPLVFASAVLLAITPVVAHVFAPAFAVLAAAAVPFGDALHAVAFAAVTLPTSLLVISVRFFGTLPAAAVSTGRLSTEAAVALGVLLLSWGIWWLPEVRPLRVKAARLQRRAPRSALVLACLLTAALAAFSLRPDGRVRVAYLSAGKGQAVFIRGPTGQTALVMSGAVDATRLAAAIASQLAPWEHTLDTVAPLDSPSSESLQALQSRYPSEVRAPNPARIELGGGAVMDLYPGAASVSYASTWRPLLGDPPHPASG